MLKLLWLSSLILGQFVFTIANAQSVTEGVSTAVQGSLSYVVCTSGAELNVRDQSLNNILFQVKRFDEIKPVQSWDAYKQTKIIGGKSYTFVKIQAPSRPTNNIGWVAEAYVKLRASCAGAPQDPMVGSTPPAEPEYEGWIFPLIGRPTESYLTGMRRFGAGRSSGRSHAAVDLYRSKKGEDVIAVARGKIIRALADFYQGTFSLEVRLDDGKIVRYGEITGRAAPNTGLNKVVTPGQVAGYMGKVNSNCCSPMLHLEVYAGTATGPLTVKNANKFGRRKDLIDPSALVQDAEYAKFGVSH